MTTSDDSPHLGLWRGLQVTQAVPQTLSAQAELAVLLLNAGHTLQNHLIVLMMETNQRSRTLLLNERSNQAEVLNNSSEHMTSIRSLFLHEVETVSNLHIDTCWHFYPSTKIGQKDKHITKRTFKCSIKMHTHTQNIK